MMNSEYQLFSEVQEKIGDVQNAVSTPGKRTCQHGIQAETDIAISHPSVGVVACKGRRTFADIVCTEIYIFRFYGSILPCKEDRENSEKYSLCTEYFRTYQTSVSGAVRMRKSPYII
ncbi:hypothetical protein [Ruminococcus albus]|uniref:hypothetical protein n=1 Tax=Ruminococcus albus TaxID=1264 RepID=UPI001D1452B4|nr:hypothetical protein [Ruminococcus albus]MCC3352871.1 hypothetical protein [Ruminococcus albus 8]